MTDPWLGRLLRVGLLGVALLAPSPAALAVDKVRVIALFKDKAMVQLDGKRRLLRAGQTSPEGVTLVSADSEGAVLEIDGERRTLALGSHIGSSFRKPDKGPVLRIWPTPDGMYTAVGSINGYPVDFLVDTGATLVVMNANEARRLGIDYRVVGEPGLSSTASGVARTYYVRLARVKVGEIELRDVQAGVIDGPFPTEVLLGNSFLGRLNLKREGRALELQRKF